MLKKIIALFLTFTLLLQVLPVKQVGYVLFGNQINEELPHGMSVAKQTQRTPLNEDLVHDLNTIDFLCSSNKVYGFSLYTSDIPSNHSLEILVPPPDIA
ncbi:MAG TPA: hypothetical protein VH396_07745 [Chitinophagaceae bacterium]